MADAPFTTRIMRSMNVSSTAVALSGVTEFELQSNKINFVWVTGSAAFRYAFDGSSPSGTVGHSHPANTPLQIFSRQQIRALRFAASSGMVVTFTLSHSAVGGGIQ